MQTIAKLIEQNGLLQRTAITSGDTSDPNSKAESSYADLEQMFSFLAEIQENKAEDIISDITQQFDELIQRTETQMNDLNQKISEIPAINEGSPSLRPQTNGSDMMSDTIETVSPSPLPSPSADRHSREADSLISATGSDGSQIYTPLAAAERSYSFEFQDEEENQNFVDQNNINNTNNTQQIIFNGQQNEDKKIVSEKMNGWQENGQSVPMQSAVPENKLVKQLSSSPQNEVDVRTYDLNEFAEKFFNNHIRDFGGGVIRTLTRKRRTGDDYISKNEMLVWTANSAIPTSHIHLHDPENVVISCAIFKELCKYIEGLVKPEAEVRLIQTIIGHGIEREELRDEIFVQLLRQSNGNPSREDTIRVWMMLGLTTAAFQPSKVFAKYFYSYLRKHLRKDASISCYAQFCIDNLHSPKAHIRRMPPSSLEVNAVRTLSSLVCRFYFLDGRTKAIDIHPCDTANDAMACLSNKIGLRCLDGWALYEVTPEYERVIKGHDYLADIITNWEMLQKNTTYGTKASAKQSQSLALGGGDCRFVFKKRLFRNTCEIPHDPIEVNLLYAQAVHSVVKKDEFPVSERIALQLAGLQAQVSLGEYVDGRTSSYEDVENYICFRIRKAVGYTKMEWALKIAEAHKMYGKGKADLIAKVWYLSVVMQYPTYGATLFPVTYKGYLSYGHNLMLGVNSEGILITNPLDKSILNAYRYCDIESLTVFPTENLLSIKLIKTVPDSHKCFTFETNQKEEIASLVASYSPNHSNWMRQQTNAINGNTGPNGEPTKRRLLKMTLEDRMKLHHDVVNCRRVLIDSNIMRKPTEESRGLIRNTLRRLNRVRLDKLKQEFGSEFDEAFFRHFPHSFWAYTKSPTQNSILVISDPELETMAVNNFNAILAYSGLNIPENEENSLDEKEWGSTPRQTERDQIRLAQSILDKCLRKDADILRNEFFLQLIKQTTDHPDPNSRVNIRHWQLLALACSITYPSDRRILAYLHSHLRRCALDEVTQEGQYSHFTLRNLQGTLETRGRKLAPSRAEILSTINCRRIYARIHFLDGQFQAVEFDACAVISEVIEQIQLKIDLRQNAPGYALYQMLGPTNEQALQPEEKVGDAIAYWEKWHEEHLKTGTLSKKTHERNHFFIFKVSLSLIFGQKLICF